MHARFWVLCINLCSPVALLESAPPVYRSQTREGTALCLIRKIINPSRCSHDKHLPLVVKVLELNSSQPWVCSEAAPSCLCWELAPAWLPTTSCRTASGTELKLLLGALRNFSRVFPAWIPPQRYDGCAQGIGVSHTFPELAWLHRLSALKRSRRSAARSMASSPPKCGISSPSPGTMVFSASVKAWMT